MEAKAISVSFGTGRDVLRAYWGFLSNGGLVIPDGRGLAVGEPVRVRVVIESLRKEYVLRGQVVRRPEITPAALDHAVIEFHPGEPHDLLLSAAWSETDNVPARRHPRHAVDRRVMVRTGGRELAGRLLNLSLGGCCVTAPEGGKLDVGARAHLGADDVWVAGVVRWRRADDVGVEFDEGAVADAERFVRQFV